VTTPTSSSSSSPFVGDKAPFDPNGPLCPLLDDASFLFRVYSVDVETRDAVKRIIKKAIPARPGQNLKKDDPAQMGEALRTLFNSPRLRAQIAEKEREGSAPLHAALYQWLLTGSREFVENVTQESGAETDGDRVFFRPKNLEDYLAKHGVPAEDSQKKTLAILAAAFAFFEPENARGLVSALAAKGEPFTTWFAVRAS